MPVLGDKSSKDIGRALLRALQEDNLEAARYFLTASEVDVRCVLDSNLHTALHYAAMKNYGDVVQSLLDKAANFNVQDKEGCTPLHYATKKEYTDIVRALLDKGATPNIKTTKYFHTALHLAALTGHAGIVKMLLDKGADVNVQDKDGCTPLHYAAKKGCADSVRMLLEKGANVNARAKSDYTPLHFAVAQGYKDIAELLLELGADPGLTDDKHYTVLHFAAKKGLADIMRVLLLKGAEVNIPGKDGKRPQDLTRNPNILADLQSCGAAIEGFTPPEDYQPIEVPNSERLSKIREFTAFEKYFKTDKD